jgi:hypothetical protein
MNCAPFKTDHGWRFIVNGKPSALYHDPHACREDYDREMDADLEYTKKLAARISEKLDALKAARVVANV